jgi:hydrogenase expression/formation protein HypC
MESIAMCLAVPGRVLSIAGEDIQRVGRVDFGGIVKEINLAYVPEAKVDDHVLVHVGFAISVLDEAEAARVFEHLRALGELGELEAAAS